MSLKFAYSWPNCFQCPQALERLAPLGTDARWPTFGLLLDHGSKATPSYRTDNSQPDSASIADVKGLDSVEQSGSTAYGALSCARLSRYL